MCRVIEAAFKNTYDAAGRAKGVNARIQTREKPLAA